MLLQDSQVDVYHTNYYLSAFFNLGNHAALKTCAQTNAASVNE